MSWVSFHERAFTGKTYIWDVYPVDGSTPIGQIKWYPQWRQYCLFPASGTLWNADCMVEVATFVHEQMVARGSKHVIKNLVVLFP